MKAITIKEANKQLKRMQDIYRFIKDENVKTDDSILTIIGKKFHDENTISDYLAYIFDPQLNGVGTQPLNNFLKRLGSSFDLSELDHIDIQREYRLPNNRRIDFLITVNEERMIAIEHKVFSEEHGDQTKDYEKEINQLFYEKGDNITYVFLTPDGKNALNPSFIPIAYDELVTDLKNVIVDFVADIRKAVLYNEMIFHLEGYFLNNKSIALSDKTSLYLEHHEMIQDLKNQFDQDYHNVFQYIESVIKNYFSNNLEDEWDFDFKKDRSYHQIFKPHWKTKDLDVHFEVNLCRDNLISNELSFLLDIEGKKRSTFKDNHDGHLKERLKNVLANNNILYRNGERPVTFAIKTYHFLSPENIADKSLMKTRLIEMIKDFEDFIDAVDEELNRFYNNQ